MKILTLKIFQAIKQFIIIKQCIIDKMPDIGDTLIQLFKMIKVYKLMDQIMYSSLFKIIKDNG